jgi:hypothetical protein
VLLRGFSIGNVNDLVAREDIGVARNHFRGANNVETSTSASLHVLPLTTINPALPATVLCVR